jgi:hypothetical protein
MGNRNAACTVPDVDAHVGDAILAGDGFFKEDQIAGTGLFCVISDKPRKGWLRPNAHVANAAVGEHIAHETEQSKDVSGLSPPQTRDSRCTFPLPR